MTHLIWRKGWAYFRFRLPEDLAGNPAPTACSDEIAVLINPRTGAFKRELWQSLSLTKKDDAKAKRIVGGMVRSTSDQVEQARRLLKNGPRKFLSVHEVEQIAAETYADGLAWDEQMRRRGLGLRLPFLAALRIDTGHKTPDERQSGMTTDDLGLMRHIADKQLEELRQALALMRPPQRVRDRVASELIRLGVEPSADERLEVELEVLRAEVRTWEAIRDRLRGAVIPTPARPNQAVTQAPTLRKALELWKEGVGIAKGTRPRRNSVIEAEAAVRRFVELNGNLPVTDIKRPHVRAFRDAMEIMPKHLPKGMKGLPIGKLLSRVTAELPRRSASTVTKAIRLLGAIASAAAQEFDFAERSGGWTNPFDGITATPRAVEAEDRLIFTTEDLQRIFSSPVYTAGERPRGGRGEAAFWFPLIALYTGARLEEIAQLNVRDVREVPGKQGLWYFDITDTGEGQSLKVGTKNRREVPVHPELVRLGLLTFRASREKNAGRDAVLFPGFEFKKAEEGRSGAWSKWFGRQLRTTCKITDRRKVFHCFRHTFKDACRNAHVPEDHHDQLTSHAARRRNVGRGYGQGLTVETLFASMKRVVYPGLKL